jgi:hypothetical protein
MRDCTHEPVRHGPCICSAMHETNVVQQASDGTTLVKGSSLKKAVANFNNLPSASRQDLLNFLQESVGMAGGARALR